MIDLRSDTVTRPTAGMKKAMNEAALGDDVFGEDPTVNLLQEKAAEMFGMEAALFCPSGTMTNQIAIKVHTRPGDEVICDTGSHVYNYEGGGIAFHSGASVKLIPGTLGKFTVKDVEASIQPDNIHHPVSSLVVVENTCNRGGGGCWDPDEIKRISTLCKEKGLKFHLDGARLFNAIVEGKGSPGFFGSAFDSISICLSKGLGAPVGSLLLGDNDFIKRSLRIRKVFGGGMRQAGILAAAGIYALDHQIDRLNEDHAKAKMLAQTLEKLSWVDKILPVETNIIVFETKEQEAVIEQVKSQGILVVPFGPGRIRMVMHLDVTDEDLKKVNDVLEQLEIQ